MLEMLKFAGIGIASIVILVVVMFAVIGFFWCVGAFCAWITGKGAYAGDYVSMGTSVCVLTFLIFMTLAAIGVFVRYFIIS